MMQSFPHRQSFLQNVQLIPDDKKTLIEKQYNIEQVTCDIKQWEFSNTKFKKKKENKDRRLKKGKTYTYT